MSDIFVRVKKLLDALPKEFEMRAFHVDYDTYYDVMKDFYLQSALRLSAEGTKLFGAAVKPQDTRPERDQFDELSLDEIFAVSTRQPALLVLEWTDRFGFSHYIADERTDQKFKDALR